MSKMFRGIALLVLVMLTGCEELKNLTQKTESETETAPAVVSARICHIARIGSLANLSEDIWDADSGSKTEEAETVMPLSKLMSSEISGHVGQEVDDDFMKIVESAAQEAVAKEGLQGAGAEKAADELDLAVEIVEEETPNNAVSRKKRDENVRAKNGGRMLIESDDAEEETSEKNAPKTADDAGDIEDAVPAEEEEMMEISVGPAVPEEETEEEPAEDADEDAEEDADALSASETDMETAGKDTEDPAAEEPAEDRDEMEERLEKEISSQAEEFVELLKKVPEEIREEVRKNNFQNLSFRVVKLPGSLLFGKTASEYYVIRTMEYTGSALSHDYQALHLSSAYMKWMESLEKYLDTMALDENNHEIWVEAPEYWNSEVE